jgi:hypothetical protein
MQRKHTRHWAVSILLLVTTGWTIYPGEKSNLPLPPAAALDSIQEADLLQHAEFLASDELGGRYALSPSIRIAARYLASRLRHFGYRGGADQGSFLQKVEIVSEKFDPTATFLEAVEGGETKRFALGEAFNVTPPYVHSDISGPLVLAPLAYNLVMGNSDGEPRDLKGKIAVVPVSFGWLKSGGAETRSRRWSAVGGSTGLVRNVAGAAAEKGAIGVVLITQDQTAGPRFPETARAPSTYSGRLRLAAKTDERARLPVVNAYQPLIEWMFGSGMTLDALFSPEGVAATRDLGKSLRINMVNQGPRLETHNVIGILDGADPKLKEEYVLVSAHYDHLPTAGENIFNGADDDGSGTATVLEIAQAFAIGPRPQRSILIIFHTAEEENLMGSTYFVEHPAVPLKSIVADLNVDMVGRTRAPGDTHPANLELGDANTVYLIGSDKLSTELHQLSEQTNEDTVRMNLDYRYSAPEHPQRLYYRSDHWNYAKSGIPVIFYFTGLHEDYHRPTDDVDKLDFKKMARIGRLIFSTAWRVANLDHRVKVDGHESKP